ncbi:MAG: GNAT family N-acetyltransferase [Kiritimatiellales bacterium]|nr:GNAT family N-acetyltransferase [Kiritimatiellales bacterium]
MNRLTNVALSSGVSHGLLSGNLKEIAVRPAQASDAGVIADIAASASITSVGSLDRGFLLYPWTSKEYEQLAVLRCGLCVCLIAGTTVGFITGFPGQPLNASVSAVVGKSGGELLSGMIRCATKMGDSRWHVLYQMALSSEFRGKGLGLHFVRLYFQLYPGPHYGVVPEKPILSIRRVFWHTCGFRRIGAINVPQTRSTMIDTHEQSPCDCYSWGVYRAPHQRYNEEGTR